MQSDSDPVVKKRNFVIYANAILGKGSYGTVYAGWDSNREEMVAIKRQSLKSTAAAAELKVFWKLPPHPNILRLIDAYQPTKEKVGHHQMLDMVFPWHNTTLWRVWKTAQGFLPYPDCRKYAREMMCGVRHLHAHDVCHRDLVMPNMLLSFSTNILQIADMGLAVAASQGEIEKVVTQFTGRAPEVLFSVTEIAELQAEMVLGPGRGSASSSETTTIRDYDSSAMDMWSAGAVIAQLEFSTILFDQQAADSQLQAMIDFLGPPDADWPEVSGLPLWNERSYRFHSRQPEKPPRSALACPKRVVRPRPPGHSAIDLTVRLLTWNPSSRLTAAQAFEHEHMLEPGASPASTVIQLTDEPSSPSTERTSQESGPSPGADTAAAEPAVPREKRGRMCGKQSAYCKYFRIQVNTADQLVLANGRPSADEPVVSDGSRQIIAVKTEAGVGRAKKAEPTCPSDVDDKCQIIAVKTAAGVGRAKKAEPTCPSGVDDGCQIIGVKTEAGVGRATKAEPTCPSGVDDGCKCTGKCGSRTCNTRRSWNIRHTETQKRICEDKAAKHGLCSGCNCIVADCPNARSGGNQTVGVIRGPFCFKHHREVYDGLCCGDRCVLNGRLRKVEKGWCAEMKLLAANAWWLQGEKPPDVQEFEDAFDAELPQGATSLNKNSLVRLWAVAYMKWPKAIAAWGEAMEPCVNAGSRALPADRWAEATWHMASSISGDPMREMHKSISKGRMACTMGTQMFLRRLGQARPTAKKSKGARARLRRLGQARPIAKKSKGARARLRRLGQAIPITKKSKGAPARVQGALARVHLGAQQQLFEINKDTAVWEKILACTPDSIEVPKTSEQHVEVMEKLDKWFSSFPAQMQQGKGGRSEEAVDKAYTRKHIVRKFVLSFERHAPGSMADVTWEQLRCANPDANNYTAKILSSDTWAVLEEFWGLNPLMIACWTCFLGAVPGDVRKQLMAPDVRVAEMAKRLKSERGSWPSPDVVGAALKELQTSY